MSNLLYNVPEVPSKSNWISLYALGNGRRVSCEYGAECKLGRRGWGSCELEGKARPGRNVDLGVLVDNQQMLYRCGAI
jgi:hypothetical protein